MVLAVPQRLAVLVFLVDLVVEVDILVNLVALELNLHKILAYLVYFSMEIPVDR